MKLSHIGIGLAVALTALAADKLTLKDGSVISGTYLGASAREVRIETGDQIRTLHVEDIDSIHFGGPQQGNQVAALSTAAGTVLL